MLVCDATSVAVSPSPVIAVGKSALSAVGLMPPCGVRARVYPDPAVLGAGLGENIVSIELLPQTRNGHDGTAQQLLYAGDQHIYMMWGVTPDGCTASRAETPPSRMNLNPATFGTYSNELAASYAAIARARSAALGGTSISVPML